MLHYKYHYKNNSHLKVNKRQLIVDLSDDSQEHGFKLFPHHDPMWQFFHKVFIVIEQRKLFIKAHVQIFW